MAATTILLASVRALGEDNLKRRLAYSTVSQLSYIVLGAALGSLPALAAAMYHIAAHGYMKITLFFCAGAVATKTHREQVHEFGGLARRMPVTMSAFALAASGLAGIPLLVGFISKWNLGIGALQAGHGIFVLVLVTSGLLNLAYFFPIVYDAFFRGTPAEFGEARPSMSLPLALTAAAAVLLGVFPDAGLSFYRLAWQAATSVVSSGELMGALP